MFIQYSNLKDDNAIRIEVKKRINLYSQQLTVVKEVFEVLKQFEGKQINRRIATALKDTPTLAPYTIHYHKYYSWYALRIWGNGLDYNSGSLSLNLGYLSEGDKLNLDTVRENFSGYFLNEGRIKQLQEGLPKIYDFCAKWNDTVKTLQEINKEASKYGMNYEFDFTNDR